MIINSQTQASSLLDYIGSEATHEEADALKNLLLDAGFDNTDIGSIPEDQFFALAAEAVSLCKTTDAESK